MSAHYKEPCVGYPLSCSRGADGREGQRVARQLLKRKPLVASGLVGGGVLKRVSGRGRRGGRSCGWRWVVLGQVLGLETEPPGGKPGKLMTRGHDCGVRPPNLGGRGGGLRPNRDS